MFGPVDRIGQLTMRDLDIADTRARLELYASQGQLLDRHTSLIGDLEPGGARAIAAPNPEAEIGDEVPLERASFDFGAD